VFVVVGHNYLIAGNCSQDFDEVGHTNATGPRGKPSPTHFLRRLPWDVDRILIRTLLIMKALFLVFLLFCMLAKGQVISPCITDCVTLFCYKGVTDTPCYCVSQQANINKCITGIHGCDTLAQGQAQVLQSQFCKILLANRVDFLGGSSVSTSSSISLPSNSATDSSPSAGSGRFPWE
jgi:hypothetical protein